MVRLEGAGFAHAGEAVLSGLDLSIPLGESCAVIGPSGSGKTTLLHLMAGLLRPSAGQVLIAGQELRKPRQQTGLILQNLGLFPWKSARDNVRLACLSGPSASGADAGERADRLLAELGLSAHADKFPAQLSGGQRQRVAIARALVRHPDLLLMDEAASALDALSREALQDLILGLWRTRPLTLVLVTHSIEEAVVLGRRILVLPIGGRLAGFVNPVQPDPQAPSLFRPREHPQYATACHGLRQLLVQETG